MPSGVYIRTEWHKEICRKNNPFKKGHIPWNKNTHIQTNTGKTHFKKGIHFSKQTIEKSAKTRKGKVYHLRTNGKIKFAKGYIGIYIPSHPFAYHKHRYVPEHRLVVEKIIGRYLKPCERVHHINGIKDDNRPQNLILFINESFHQKYERNINIPSTAIVFDGSKFIYHFSP